MNATVVFEITHNGQSNFVVRTPSDLLVNEIGAYRGTVFAGDAFDATPVEITADGSWTLTVRALFTLGVSNGKVTGRGDAVVILPRPDITASIVHDGESNFAIWTHGTERDLPINDIGPYSGTVILRGEILEITADGNWSITPQ